jgi:hypothetical protein
MLVFSRCSVSQDRLYEDRDSYNGSTDTPKRRNTGIPGNVKNPTGFSRVEYVSRGLFIRTGGMLTSGTGQLRGMRCMERMVVILQMNMTTRLVAGKNTGVCYAL